MWLIYYLQQDRAKQHIAATLLLCMLSFSLSKAVIDLVPAEVVFVCPGGQLNLICKTNASYMVWNVTGPQYQRSSRHVLSRFGLSQSILWISLRIDESNIFNISQVLDETLALPLVSVMFSDNVTASINGTLISCTEYYNFNSNLDVWITNTLTTRLHIIERGAANYSPSNVMVNVSEFFDMNSIMATLEWTQENDVTYNISIFPQILVANIKMSGSSSIQLTLLYNTYYNVSIVATRCETTTTIIPLHYVKCRNPLSLANGQNFTSSESWILNVSGYSHPAMEGENVNFTCSRNHVLIGPHSAVCMGNGEWEPDPREAECKANCGPPIQPPNGYIFPYSSTIEGAVVTILCWNDEQRSIRMEGNLTCNHHGVWEPNPSEVCGTELFSGFADSLVSSLAVLIAVLLFTSVMLFIVGFFCGRFSRQQKPAADETLEDTGHSPPLNVLYEEVVTRQEVTVELKQNEAYGPLRPQ